MGQFGLELHNTEDFLGFLSRSGYLDEYDFWSSLSTIDRGTTFDHMRDYLTSEGYTGSPHDQFRQFLEVQVGNTGTVQDMAHTWYLGTFSPGGDVSDGFITEGGDPLTTESGDQLFTEGT